MMKIKFQHFILLLLIISGIFVFFTFFKSANELNCSDCNIVVISIDTLRADHVGFYGYQQNTTPNLDNFAKESIVFSNAFTQSSWTLPSHMTLFTSLYPSFHRVQSRDESLSNDILTLPQILKIYGYQTAGFVADFDLDPKYGFSHGFDVYNATNDWRTSLTPDIKKLNGYNDSEQILYDSFNQTIPKAINWIKQNENKKFFVFVHGYDAHAGYPRKDLADEKFYTNYSGPLKNDLVSEDELYSIRSVGNALQMNISGANGTTLTLNLTSDDINYIKARYDAGIYYADSNVGNFLSFLEQQNLLNKTIVVIVSDHGEALLENGWCCHHHFEDSILHVVFMVHLPSKKHAVVQDIAGLIDVMPTVLNLVNIESPSQAQGKNLVPLFRQNNSEIHNFLISESLTIRRNMQAGPPYKNNDSRLNRPIVLITNSYELTTDERNLQLFNWKKDPNWTTDLYGLNSTLDDELKSTLLDFINTENTTEVQRIAIQPYP